MIVALLIGATLAAFSAVTAAAAWLSVEASRHLPAAVARSSRARAALVVVPVILGASVALSLTSPLAALGGCHCLSHPHHVHLCFEHSSFSWPLVLVALLGGASALWQLNRSLAVARAAVETDRWASRLACDLTDGLEVAPALGARAVTIGFLRPRAVFGSLLWAKLDVARRRAVAAHELAHVARRDVLTLLCLRIAACAMPRFLGVQLVDGWRRAAELTCDRIAADRIGDPCVLADALVACANLQADIPLPAAALSLVDGDDLEARVAHLLASPSDRSPGAPASGDLLSVVAIAVGLGFWSAWAGGSAAHHAFETVLGWIS